MLVSSEERMSLRQVTRRYKRQVLAAQIEFEETKDEVPRRWCWRDKMSSIMHESSGPARGGVHCE